MLGKFLSLIFPSQERKPQTAARLNAVLNIYPSVARTMISYLQGWEASDDYRNWLEINDLVIACMADYRLDVVPNADLVAREVGYCLRDTYKFQVHFEGERCFVRPKEVIDESLSD